MGKTTISWCDFTHNPWIGCTKVSAGCDFCYAERDWDHRHHRVTWGPDGERSRTTEGTRRRPLIWNEKAGNLGVRYRIFCLSLGDILDNQVPLEWQMDIWRLVDRTPNLDWLFLTKRPQNYRKRVPEFWVRNGCPPNVWWGVSAENQEAYEERIDHLKAIPAQVRFLSCEPLLGQIELRESDAADVHWVVVGGESGPKARAMDPTWARMLRNQCQAMGIAYHFKQVGSIPWVFNEKHGTVRTTGAGRNPNEWPHDLNIRDFPAPQN